MPTRHLMEKENILFLPPAGRPPFLNGSVWGRTKERCLGGCRPFPNTTRADMFIFRGVMRKQPSTSSSPTLSQTSPPPLTLPHVFTCSPPTLENVQSCQVSRSRIHRKQVQGVVVIVFQEAFWKKRKIVGGEKNPKQFLEEWWVKSQLKENVFLHLWFGQIYQSRWRQAQGCGTQLECQNAMETSSTGSHLWTLQKKGCCWCCGTIVGFTLLEKK